MSNNPRYTNPFIFTTPVKGEDFFGRDDLLKQIFSYINRGESISLVGERRTGKTSILQRVLELKEQALYQPSQHLLVFQDFLGLQSRDERELWLTFLKTLSKTVADEQTILDHINLAIKQLQSEGLLFSTLFKLFAMLRHDGYKVTFLFDGFEVIANKENPLDIRFYKLLRNLAEDDYTSLTYLITTREPLSNIERFLEQKYTFRSPPLFAILRHLVVEPFSEEEARQMMIGLLNRTSLSLRTKLCFWLERNLLFELSSFHPFFLQRACYFMFEHCVLSDDSFVPQIPKEEIVDAFLNDSVSLLEKYWQASPTREQDVLRKLAAKEAIDWQSMIAVRRRLKNRSLIVQTSTDWRLFSSAFERWINEKSLEQQLQASFPTLPEYQQAFRLLSVFRYLSKGVLEQLLTEVKRKPDWYQLNRITEKVELLWERLADTSLLRSDIDERLFSHLTPSWRQQGNLVLQATNLALYQRLHQDARTVFSHFAFGESMYDTTLRITCFLELLYHLTQETQLPPSEESRHKLTQEVREQLNRFLSSWRDEAVFAEDEGFADSLYELNYLLENDQELWKSLRRAGESDIMPQLMAIISMTTKELAPEPLHRHKLVYA